MKEISAAGRITCALRAFGSEVNVTGRKDRSGNFGGKIDELVKQFPHERSAPRRKETGDKAKAGTDDRHINDRLFEAAWRKRH